jgi:hypothetical protein
LPLFAKLKDKQLEVDTSSDSSDYEEIKMVKVDDNRLATNNSQSDEMPQ